MSTLADRLNSIMLEKNVSQAELARSIGIKQPSIFKILNGRTLNPKNILEIATALNVDPHWLKTGEGERSPVVKETGGEYIVQRQDQIKVDLLSVSAAANSSGVVNPEYPDVIQSISFSTKGFFDIVGRKTADGIYMITVPTDSMSPTIGKGDIVFIDTKETEYTGEGIYIFDLDGETYIKRLQRVPGGVMRALSDNSLYPPFDIEQTLFSTAVIRGKFIRVLPVKPREL